MQETKQNKKKNKHNKILKKDRNIYLPINN